MNNYRDNFVNLAKSYLSIKRVDKNKLVDFYNANCFDLVKKSRKYRITYTDNWCAMFVSVCAYKNGLKTFPYEVSVYQMCLLAKETNTFYRDVESVKSGDLIIYNWNGDYIPDHVGIVKDIKNGIITTIEGNYNSSVRSRTLSTHSASIHGFISLVE